MGKFVNTNYVDSIDNIIDVNKKLINNPFYLFNDKGRGFKVTYYNINKAQSTLDPGSKISYTDLGDNSPIRYNKIYDFLLFQLNKFEINLENGDFGLEAEPITGESYILPNTIVPMDGDYFEIDHVKDSTWLFKVTDSSMDTLDNGSNCWKINWQLDRTSNREILNNVVDEFEFITTIEGTNTKAVVLRKDYKIAQQLDDLATTLRNYFRGLFYSDKIQSFTYQWYNFYNMYDSYSIEFIIRNKLLYSSSNYLSVQHQIQLPSTFSIDYDRCVFRAFELKDIKLLASCKYQAQANLINDVTSIFHTRYENYFALDYNVIAEENSPFNPRMIIPIIDEDLIDRIINNNKYNLVDDDKRKMFNNVFIKYFNNESINNDDIEYINEIDFEPIEQIYYKVLLLIFCVDSYTKNLLS